MWLGQAVMRGGRTSFRSGTRPPRLQNALLVPFYIPSHKGNLENVNGAMQFITPN